VGSFLPKFDVSYDVQQHKTKQKNGDITSFLGSIAPSQPHREFREECQSKKQKASLLLLLLAALQLAARVW
jgi:hypothetical protein